MAAPVSTSVTPGLACGASPDGTGERRKKRGLQSESGQLGDCLVSRLDFSANDFTGEKKGKRPTPGAAI